MPSNAATVARSIRLWRDQNLSPQAASRVLATIARQRRDELIASGDASPTYQTFVDGREGAAEETVRPEGAIVYKFNLLGQAATFAMGFVLTRSPVESGEFRRSWFVAVDGKRWTGDLSDIPAGSEVMVANPVPYARKIDVGHMRMSVPHGIIEGARQAVRNRFPTLDAQRQMVVIPEALGGGYVLKGRFRQGHRQFARTGLKRDTQAGEALTYPALIISTRI